MRDVPYAESATRVIGGAEITNIDCIRRYGEVCFKISDAEEALI